MSPAKWTKSEWFRTGKGVVQTGSSANVHPIAALIVGDQTHPAALISEALGQSALPVDRSMPSSRKQDVVRLRHRNSLLGPAALCLINRTPT